jgi:hypothetical protein
MLARRVSAIGAGLYSIGIPKDSVLQYEIALKADKFLLIAHGTADEVAAPIFTRLHLLKEFGETKLEGSTLFNTPKWNWPAR